jgi:hypothetical protein
VNRMIATAEMRPVITNGLDLGDRGPNDKGREGMDGIVYSASWLLDNSPRLQYKQTKT